jgi:hypothetical protein
LTVIRRRFSVYVGRDTIIAFVVGGHGKPV